MNLLKFLKYLTNYKIILILILLFQNIIRFKNFFIFQENYLLYNNEKINLLNELYHIYNLLLYNINISHIYSQDKFYNHTKGSSKVLLCAIGKNENLYAKEFIEHYLFLGFDKIIIFDNNDLKGEYFNDILIDYISKKK